MPEVTNLLLAGVGGQGTILAKGLLAAGRDVKMSEVHGMAQRGGSVTTQVRYGDKVSSPIIGRGSADVLVAFEAMEAMRWIEFLKPGGKLVVNEHKIPSAPILMGRSDYPGEVVDRLKAKVDTYPLKASEIALGLGNLKAQNVVLFGALVEVLELTDVDWEDVISHTVKPVFVDLNLAAYRAGRKAVTMH
ncbi:indolepyruvate oxidoreductase subunit beta [Breoghania sp.]|uniref:indolepyruvate oxidoreductase subunit beta n=1 Tax=Breoghania sp. TaxID=2065378 RepID=UPI00261FFE55|nr:indolepyruvate oxidoreductase subunit beta [Breoghania sp.]MDJ0931687.1 indolepyruvate oxidoreductase subunit beta [Breoghania sp.]